MNRAGDPEVGPAVAVVGAGDTSEEPLEPEGPDATDITAATDTVEPLPWAWHAVRVSGLFLAVLVVWHVAVTFVVNDVGQTTAVTVTNHWQDTTWRALEWVTLVLALGHAGIGLDLMLRNRSWTSDVAATAARVASGVVIGALMVAVSAVVPTYR